MLCVGAWATAIGFGVIPPIGKDSLAQQDWFNRFGKHFKYLGPVMLICAIALISMTFFGLR